jgi:hypothetical protein
MDTPSALVGSSATSSLGSRAIRCRWPPDSSPGLRRAWPAGGRTASSSSYPRWSSGSGGGAVHLQRLAHGERRIEHGGRTWCTSASLCRAPRSSARLIRAMSRPSSSTRPLWRPTRCARRAPTHVDRDRPVGTRQRRREDSCARPAKRRTRGPRSASGPTTAAASRHSSSPEATSADAAGSTLESRSAGHRERRCSGRSTGSGRALVGGWHTRGSPSIGRGRPVAAIGETEPGPDIALGCYPMNDAAAVSCLV